MEIYWVVFLVFYMIWSSAWHITVLGWLSCESSAFEAALLWCYCHKLYTGSSFIKHWCVYNGSWWLRSRSSSAAHKLFSMSHVSEPWKNAPFTDAGQLSQPEKKAIHTIEAQFLHTYYILEFSRQKWAKLKLGSEWCKLRLCGFQTLWPKKKWS